MLLCFHMNTIEEFFQLTKPFMLTHDFYQAHYVPIVKETKHIEKSEKRSSYDLFYIPESGARRNIQPIQEIYDNESNTFFHSVGQFPRPPLPPPPLPPCSHILPLNGEDSYDKSSLKRADKVSSTLRSAESSIFVSKNKDDPLFWCLYVAKYGKNEVLSINSHHHNHEKAYTTITNFTNQMMKEKEEIIDYIQQNMINIKLYFKKQMMTFQQLNEMMADILSNLKTSIEMSFLWAHYYDLSICFVDFRKKFYIILDGRHETSPTTVHTPTPSTIISFIKTKENSFHYTLHLNTEEIWKEVKEKCVWLKSLYKLPTISSFKIAELTALSVKWGLEKRTANLKKAELYSKLQKYLCQEEDT